MVLGIISSLMGGGQSEALSGLSTDGVMWAVAAAGIYSIYIIAGTRFTAHTHPIYASALVISAAAIVYLFSGALSGTLHLAVTPLALALAGAIAVFCTVVAIATFFAGLKLVGPSRAAIISTVEPGVTVGLALLLLDEPVGLEQALGGALILASVLLLQIRAGSSKALEAESP
jgi:drug/metabolite transporter (DMT)-like permease